MKTRLLAAAALIAAFFALDIAALFYRSARYDQEKLADLSQQYTKTILQYFPRGTICDRKGVRLTNRPDPKYTFLNAPGKESVPVARFVTGSIEEIGRLDTTNTGAIGVSGLQKAYDALLNGGSRISVSAPVDARGDILSMNGIQVRDDHPNEGCTILTTLDYNLQKAFEEEIEKVGTLKQYTGVAVVLSKVDTGEILVMASWGSEMNKAVLTYQPGSLMKIVTAAALLETQSIDPLEVYDCAGSVEANGTMHYCSGHTAHGKVNLYDAFAKSCNSYFYEAARRMEYENESGIETNHLLDMAKAWGFCEYGEPVPEMELSYRDHYNFVSSQIYNEEGIFNAALGEGMTQASPLLFNKIVAAIANGKETTAPFLVKDIIDPAGSRVPFDGAFQSSFSLGIKDSTILALQEMMRLSATNGTASPNGMDKHGGVAGKTGTAQNATSKDHAWFSGYFPSEAPEFAMTVLVEQGGGSRNALDIFDKLADILYSSYPEGSKSML
ncbi:MAG: hypothetical protein LBC69_01415 [Eubacteriaceae bacterium]|jgi:cell division protein FtsI/penicillin-binding protein 2|nr:hypothetical protein [Eubacteriaceae bacterium]